MLSRKTVLISAILTAFVLSMLGGVARALQESAAPAVAAAPIIAKSLTPLEAVAVASAVLNQQEVYSVESATIDGVNAYKVVFSSGQVAFVGLDGQILSITEIEPVVVVQTFSDSGSASDSSRSSGEHDNDDHDDHDEDDDHDD